MSTKKPKKPDLKAVLTEVADFIADLQKDLDEDEGESKTSVPSGRSWVMFSKKDYGSISLFDETARRFLHLLSLLVRCLNLDIISRKAIDKKLKDTILVSLDINGLHGDVAFEDRIKQGIDELRKYIANSSLTTWKVYVRLSGIEPTFDPSNFGGTEFVVFNDFQFARFKEEISQSNLGEEQKRDRIRLIEEFSDEKLAEKPVAIVEVQAIDIEAARNRAIKRLRATVDVINFYSDILYSPKTAFVQVFGNSDMMVESLPVVMPGESPRLFLGTRRTGPTSVFAMQKLIHDKGRAIGSLRASELLAKKQLNPIEERVIAAMQWAGRASIDERNEEAFLLYAIALESLVMEKSSESELGYRLKTRVAHLLGDNLEDRKHIRKNVSDLYGVRSAIVHKGLFEVSDTDLSLIRLITKESILKVLTEAPFVNMNSDDEYFEWFDNRIMS